MRGSLWWIASALLLLAGCAHDVIVGDPPPPPPPPPPVADGAGNWRIPTTVIDYAPDGSMRICTPVGQLCAGLRHGEGWTLEAGVDGGTRQTLAVLPPVADHGDTFYLLDPVIFREAGGAWLIGVERERYVNDPGISRSNRVLSLFRWEAGAGEARLVAVVPVAGSRSLRRCPIRHGEPPRPGCTQDFDFGAVFDLDIGNRAGPPRFVLESHADIFPGPHAPSPGAGVTPGMMRETDPVCSYRRVFTFDPGEGAYLPDRPLPACADYLDF